jgi:hypothetical protein
MATYQQPHKQKHQIHIPMAYQIGGGGIDTGMIAPNIQNYIQNLQQNAATTIPVIDAQMAYLQDIGNRNITNALFQGRLNDMVGALSIAPIVPKPSNFGGATGETFA